MSKKLKSSTIFGVIAKRLPFIRRRYMLNGKRIKVSPAPEPTQIIWQNVGVDLKDKLKVRALSLFATIMLLGGAFGLIILLYWAQVC